MGLDMFLFAEKNVYDWNKKDKELSDKLFEATGVKVSSFKTEVGYWRKANAIHRWFVDNCQRGVDECQLTYVPIEKLEVLLSWVNQVLVDPEKLGPELLPTASGFFFGGTDYDEWYVQDLEETKQILERVLSDKILEDYDIYYQSSW